MTTSTTRVLLFATLLGAAAIPTFASGSYNVRPPKPPAAGGETKMNREKYGLGQKIYDGSVKPMGGGDASTQVDRLKMAQSKLPADAMKTKNLPALAGKLSAAELDALEYFVDRRFATKK